ncbi:cytidine deaminase [Phaeocystidibacter marisrubri]|uniref:Cytidine deaminase n=1 Tax=Phaeocystidibacter marisrubri TaxID=1577780 RepID=A0A6L3ZHM1_9FLAO|nr:cytidine deaminase [Phaeocystidibacter marisrubri]KAB2816975.1 cytidine deaminase [Phaeocystidibacter marisrubri]GGH77367.1 cytidine deaminase [Phaeocystidibacter marisrubri]
MKNHEWSATFHSGHMSELSSADRTLILKAKESRERAYAPYSRYKVGAAVQLSDGTIVTGSNQENAAYPSGLCAERVALFHAGAVYPESEVQTLAIITSRHGAIPAASCGACRQVMVESENRQLGPIRVIMADDEGNVLISNSVKDLLPFSFEPDRLG